ncbi:MAG: response regulator [Rhodobacteraceae bacterium]|nr:response regulator [Paracoccaceae bacterium]
MRAEGYEVMIAGSAAMGLEMARAETPDAIILDVIMPERDGWSMLKEIKADPELCEIPVILATIVADREMGLAFGAVEHLTKPVDPVKLLSTLEAIAAGRDKEVLIVDDDAATRTLFAAS